MSLTLVTNPVSGTETIFAGFKPIEFVFKREDLAITSVTSGTGGAKITVGTDLTSYLSAGDSLYLYSEGVNYTYDVSATILTITSTEITVDAEYIETGTGGYINYLKNYYVEMKCVVDGLSGADILGFSLESDGDAAGNIVIDVSIANDLNEARGEIAKEYLSDGVQEFEVKYREVYQSSSNSFTLIDNKLLVVVYATEAPEQDVILNSFDLPKIYLGYHAAICIAHADGVPGDSIELLYKEYNLNFLELANGSLGSLDSDASGFFNWKWDESETVESATAYIGVDFSTSGLYDFMAVDFAHPDFLVQ